MYMQLLRIYILFLFFISNILLATPQATSPLVLIDKGAIVEIFPSAIQIAGNQTIQKIVVHSDDGATQEDIARWTSVRIGNTFTEKSLEQLQFYLHLTQRYKRVTVEVEQAAQGIVLVLQLTVQMRVESITLRGIWVGRDELAQNYILQRGGAFDLIQHKAGVARMQRVLHDQGYVYAQVTDKLLVSPRNHSVTVILNVDLGQQVIIDSLSLMLHNQDRQTTSNVPLRDQLESVLSKRLLKKPFTEQLLQSINEIVHEVLLESGLLRYKIWLEEQLLQDKIRLAIHIDISDNKQISIQGNTAISTASLIKYIMTIDESEWLLSEPFLQQAISRYYQEHGYANTTVRVKQVGQSWDIAINEGLMHRPGKPILYGVASERMAPAMQFFESFSASEIYQDQLLQQGITHLLTWYREQGFWQASVINITYQENRDILTPIISLQEDEQSLKVPESPIKQVEYGVAGNILLSGIPIALERKLYRQCKIQPGDPLIQKNLIDTMTAISGVGIFKSVNTRSCSLPDPDGAIPIVIHSILDDPFEVRARVGFVGVSKNLNFSWGGTYKVGGSMLARSALRPADQVRMDADITRFYRHGEISYQYPWAFQRPITSLYRLFATKFDQPLSWGSSVSLYSCARLAQASSWSGAHGHILWSLGTCVEALQLYGISRAATRAIHFNPRLVDTWVPYFSCEPLIRAVALDDEHNPRSGYSITLGSKLMVPFNKGFFIGKLLSEQSLFVPLGACFIGAMRCRAGYILTKEFTSLLPSERFYLGGPTTIRSYAPDFAPPLGCYIDECGREIFIPVGGNLMLNGNIEIRICPTTLIQIVLFQDLGMLSYPGCNSRYLLASGFGLRYITPLGPIRFDIGFRPYISFPTDTHVGWFLTFGQAF